VAFTGGVLGPGGYTLQWYLNSKAYPINVGAARRTGSGRTSHHLRIRRADRVLSIFFVPSSGSSPARTYHPLFESERFRTASLDAYWISAETSDETPFRAGEEIPRGGAHKVHSVVESV